MDKKEDLREKIKNLIIDFCDKRKRNIDYDFSIIWLYLIILTLVIITLLGIIVWRYVSSTNIIEILLSGIKNYVPVNLFPDGFPQKVMNYIPDDQTIYNKSTAQDLMLTNSVVSTYNISGSTINSPLGYKLVKILKTDYKTSTFVTCVVFISDDNKTLLITFTGSVVPSQYDIDFSFKLIPAELTLDSPIKGIKLHNGFSFLFNQIKTELAEIVKTSINDGIENIVITGHSLGGAMCCITSYYFWNDIKSLKNKILYSFGSPRVGNTLFAESFNSTVENYMRVNNTEDIVPQAPVSGFDNYDYEHTGNNVPFTIALGTVSNNHVLSYLNYLPECFENKAPC